MKKNNLLIAWMMAICTVPAFADEDISYGLGIKTWNNHLSSIDTLPSDKTNSSIISFTAKKGDYFVVASSLLPSTYPGSNSNLGQYMTRKDADLAVGWQLNSNISLIGGYKNLAIKTWFAETGETKLWKETAKITYIGANASNMLDANKFVYGQYTKSMNGKVDESANQQPNLKIKFYQYEAGIGYLANKNTQLTAGYRSQSYKVVDLVTKMPGFTLGASYSF